MRRPVQASCGLPAAVRILLALAAAGLFAAAAALAHPPPGGMWTPGSTADHRWRAPVATAGALPSSGNVTGDVRLVIDSGELRCWLGGVWVSCGGSGGVDDDIPEAGDFGALILSGDVASTGLVTTVQADSVALGADTTGAYVAGATAGQGLALAGSEAGTLGLVDCAALELLQRNAGDTAWTCATPAGGVSDHGALTGLADDDHAGYALLGGRAGGQAFRGGTGPGEDLTVDGTTNATRGDLILARGCYVLADDDPDVKLCPNDDVVFGGLWVQVHDGSTRLEVRADSVTVAGNVRLYPDGANAGVSVSPRGVFDADTGLGVPSSPSDELRLYAGGNVVAAAAKVAGVTTLTVAEALRLTPRAAPPLTCGAANTHGALYTDDSSALCWCDGTTWQKVVGTGSCS